MGDCCYQSDILQNRIIDYYKLFEIKDFLLLIKVIEHLENKLLELEKEIIVFHLCTIVYTKEDLDRLSRRR